MSDTLASALLSQMSCSRYVLRVSVRLVNLLLEQLSTRNWLLFDRPSSAIWLLAQLAAARQAEACQLVVGAVERQQLLGIGQVHCRQVGARHVEAGHKLVAGDGYGLAFQFARHFTVLVGYGFAVAPVHGHTGHRGHFKAQGLACVARSGQLHFLHGAGGCRPGKQAEEEHQHR